MDSAILPTGANRTMKYGLTALTNEDGLTKLQYPTSWTVLKRSEKTTLHQKHFKRLWIEIEPVKLESDPVISSKRQVFSTFFPYLSGT